MKKASRTSQSKKWMLAACTVLLFCNGAAVYPAVSLISLFSAEIFSTQKPVHVYCLCQNQWLNGQVTNHAQVELREGTSFGPLIADADVFFNSRQLGFDGDAQTYQGPFGQIEQWQRIPLHIKMQDGRTVTGYVAVVFLVQFIAPKPWAEVAPLVPLPVKWEYSEQSMHTVDVVIRRDDAELMSFEVPGNTTQIDLKRLSPNLKRGDVIYIQIYPPWTSNFEFKGNTTKRSKAEFVTTAVVSVKIAGN